MFEPILEIRHRRKTVVLPFRNESTEVLHLLACHACLILGKIRMVWRICLLINVNGHATNVE